MELHTNSAELRVASPGRDGYCARFVVLPHFRAQCHCPGKLLNGGVNTNLPWRIWETGNREGGAVPISGLPWGCAAGAWPRQRASLGRPRRAAAVCCGERNEGPRLVTAAVTPEMCGLSRLWFAGGAAHATCCEAGVDGHSLSSVSCAAVSAAPATNCRDLRHADGCSRPHGASGRRCSPPPRLDPMRRGELVGAKEIPEPIEKQRG